LRAASFMLGIQASIFGQISFNVMILPFTRQFE